MSTVVSQTDSAPRERAKLQQKSGAVPASLLTMIGEQDENNPSKEEAGTVSFNWNPDVTEVLISAVLSLVGWSVKRALTRLDEQSKRIADIELSLARDYVKHDHLGDLKREQRRIGRMLGYIQLQLVALAARLNVRVEPFTADGEEETNASV